MKTKRIEYAYRTSDHAVKFGFGSVGCYTVELCCGNSVPVAIAGFETIQEADNYAVGLVHPWDKLTRRA